MAQLTDKEMMAVFLSDAGEALNIWERTALTLTTDNLHEGLKVLLRSAHNIKGACPIVGLHTMKDDIHKIEDFLIAIRAGRLILNDSTTNLLFDIESYLRNWLDNLKQNPKFQPKDHQVFTKIESALQGASQVQIEPQAKTETKSDKEGEASPKTRSSVEENLRVPVSKVDQIIQLVGELSLYQSMAIRNVGDIPQSAKLNSAVTLMRKLTRDLQALALNLRMIPVEGLFQRLERSARLVSLQLNKPVRIVKHGEDVSLDRIVIDRISEPLIHLVRNAIDHGLEAPEERAKKGKPEAGHLTISATPEAAGVTIRISDDGRGIDRESVYKSALAKKIIDPTQPISEDEKLALIFRPGFSTAEEVTDISGRGIGLDVVYDTVFELGGSLVLSTEPGRGTSFVLSLPTNVNMMEVLIVSIKQRSYAIPTQDLAEIINLKDYQTEISTGAGRKFVKVRDRFVPLEALVDFLAVKAPSAGKEAKESLTGPALIVEAYGERIAFAVDEIVGQQQIFVRPVPANLARVAWLGGTTILTDGEPSLLIKILDIAQSRIPDQRQTTVRSLNVTG